MRFLAHFPILTFGHINSPKSLCLLSFYTLLILYFSQQTYALDMHGLWKHVDGLYFG